MVENTEVDHKRTSIPPKWYKQSHYIQSEIPTLRIKRLIRQMNLYDQPPQHSLNNNGQPNIGSSEYFQFQNVSPEMIKLGLTTGQDLLSKQTDRWTTGAFGFWTSLKIYFAVSYCLYRFIWRIISLYCYLKSTGKQQLCLEEISITYVPNR